MALQPPTEPEPERAAGEVAEAAVSRRTVQERAKRRWYAVWKVRGHDAENLVGIHEGNISAWWGLEDRFAGRRYCAGQHLRRYDSLDEAVNGFYLEAERHSCALPAKLTVWPDATADELATTSSRASQRPEADRSGLAA